MARAASVLSYLIIMILPGWLKRGEQPLAIRQTLTLLLHDVDAFIERLAL